jgi:energy-coupling factor transporter transmembrane protein EcfT
MIPWFFILPLLAAVSGIFGKFCRGFGKILFIAALILLVQSFVIKSDVVLWGFGFLKIYKAGLITGMSLSFSVMNVAGIILWMFQTTSNKELSSALDASGMHYIVTYVFMASLQMIKVLSFNSKTIMNAQQARGVEIEGNVLIRARAFFPVLVPLILGSVTGAEERVHTLESKGFDVKGPKSHIFEVERSSRDGIARVIAWVIAAAVLIIRVTLWLL